MVNLAEVLKLVDVYVANGRETVTELSRRATGKNDTIRNWKRRLDKGEEASASFHNVQAVLSAMEVELKLGGVSSSDAHDRARGKEPPKNARPDLSVKLADLFAAIVRMKPDQQAQIIALIQRELPTTKSPEKQSQSSSHG